MFEKLAGNVLTKVLSNYITEDSLSKNKVYKKAQLGVWSGYVTLNDLEVKADVINKKLRQKGQPFELVHCSLRQVEITIPWAKLSNPISSSFMSFNGGGNNNNNGHENGTSSSGQDAVVVLVIDGVHALFRMTFEFNDDELREEDIKQRRKALSISENFAKSSSSNVEEYYDKLEEATGSEKSYTELLKQRISSGLLQEIARQVHVHIRDLHIRVEDKESDPDTPFAFGITMESMHMQHDDEEDDEPESGSDVRVVSKVAQMNHFAAYWNALEYGHGLSAENSLLHETCASDKVKLTRALDHCIARRASVVPSSSKKTYIPKNTYVLLPVDGYLHALLSTTPKDLSSRPAVDIAIQLETVSTNLRDFQCVQVLKLYGERKNFNFVKKFRKYRPRDSVMQNARAWWKYAARAIRQELRGSMLRWSWVRFQERYALRARYMELYERRIRHGSNIPLSDDVTRIAGDKYGSGLTDEEQKEIQDLEDGLIGELSTSDIILFRALTSIRLGNTIENLTNKSSSQPSSWWKQTVMDAAADDNEARDELDRLLQYLDEIPGDKLVPESKNDSLNAISIVLQLEEVNFSLFSPLHFTSEETQLKRLHEKFLEFNTKVTRIGGSLKGDYKKFDFEFSIMDFNASEIRLDKSHHVIANQLRQDHARMQRDDQRDEIVEENPPFFLFAYSKKPVQNPKVDKEARMFLNSLEIVLNPECQWLAHGMQFVKEITTVANVQKFWRELSLARLNSLALGKLGFVAKAESVVSNHENIDVDFNLHCPVVRIGMGEDGDLICDTGFLSIKTEKLAGISRNKLRKVPLLEDEKNRTSDIDEVEKWQYGIDDGSLAGMISVRSRSTRRRPMRRFFFSSATSVDSATFADRGSRSLSGSFNLDDSLVQLEPNEHRKSEQAIPELQDLFYDKYQIDLRVGRITFSGESELFDVSTGFEIRTILQKSVIPMDHTLSKVRIHTVIEGIRIILNENVMSRLASGVKVWKSLLVTDVASGTFHAKRNVQIYPSHRAGSLFDNFSSPSNSDTNSEDGSSSAVNEEEFFDVNEMAESVGGDNSGVWFEDNWIADAESVIDGDSRSSFSGRRGRRRQPSVSDMSSVSDQSAGRIRRGNLDNGYLSAENLARLEEAADDEEDSAVDSQKEKDDDSFHSIMSAQGQEKLVRELEEDIAETKRTILRLSQSLKYDSGDQSNVVDSRSQERRRMRKETKLQLDRSRAELKALQVLLSDLQSFMPADGSHDRVEDASMVASRQHQTRTARALLRAKKRRHASGLETGHSLVNHLNRAIFKGSLLVNKIQVGFKIEPNCGNSDLKNSTAGSFVDLDIVTNQIGLALFHRINETKFYFSLDQVTAKIENRQDPYKVPSDIIFSGGTTDTLLPAHLPHLIAHSMEDRFLRGAVIVGKHRRSELTGQLAKTYKVRLVVGDVEFSPYNVCLRPFIECVGRLKTAVGPFEASVAASVQDSTSRECRPKQPRISDLAFRLASLRLAISHRDSIVGALALTESSLRFVQVSSPTQDRAQLDVRCTNAQLLDVLNLEAGRGLEIVGRRDPYNSLLQARARFHVVGGEETGGWVVGEEATSVQVSDTEPGFLVRNAHIGVRINPISIVVSPDATYKLFECVEETKRTILPLKKVNGTPRPQNRNKIERSFGIPLRWRLDATLRRVNIKFSREHNDEWDMSEDTGAKMLVALSVVASMQESPVAKGSLSLRMGVTDIALIRSSDDWPILEPFSVMSEVVLAHSILDRLSRESQLSPILMKPDSALSEIEAVMNRLGWDSMPNRKSDDKGVKVVLKVTPLKINISAPVIHLFAELANIMKTRRVLDGSTEKDAEEEINGGTLSISNKRSCFSILLTLDDVEMQLLREMEGKPMALASPLISFTLTDAAVDYNQGEQVTASILIRDSALFDLSCGRGIRVVGEDPEARLEFPYFVRVKLYMHHGPQTVRLHINWGRIQCLLLPSFVRSLLDLKDGLKQLQGKDSNQPMPARTVKRDLLSRFLHHPNDVNLILSADAETFECILASKDILDYVKKGETDHINVVTFRWKASLSVALALDCLCDSSMPWLTLNLDGVFTDDEDAALFKDFSNRYLFRGSGTLDNAGEGPINDLANAFTCRISHRLSSFQALRTHIARMDLATSGRGFLATPRVCFKISQPTAGEQRITNPIDFELLYRAVGASVAKKRPDVPEGKLDVELSQLLQMKSNFVDVLLYIQSKSAGGFTDSYQVSIKPILEMLKKKDTRKPVDGSHVSENGIDPSRYQLPRLSNIMKRAPTVCSLHIEGFQVTCVPGGASRLNESPIIKFELSNVFSGIGAAPVPQDLTVVPNTGAHDIVPSPTRKYVSGSELMNTTLVGWFSCQVTGHYHNRRLVAWEPVIEPWIANVRFGIDLVQVMQWTPVFKVEAAMSASPKDLAVPDLNSRDTSFSAAGKERLRDFGRLFRSPFQQSLQSPDSPRKRVTDLSHSDFCFLMLSSSARRTIVSAVYPTGDSNSSVESILFSTLPSSSPLKWLQNFGQLNRSGNPRDTDEPFSMSVVLSDDKALNINLTGALIENVMGYLDHTKNAGSKSVVPHLIRNDTGMTIRFREVLDADRAKRGENAARIILGNGSEAPLTLKRSSSQTCDPHRAFIYLEIGNFEDTVGRVNHDDFDVPKGRRSSTFFFKAAAKIPVDAVGVHRYPLDRNVDLRSEKVSVGADSRALGWIIVRVALKGSVKVVSVESPLVLKSAADADLLCEIRDHSGLSLLWRCLVPKDKGMGNEDGIVSVPADIVPFIHDRSYRLSVVALSRASSYNHEAEITSTREFMSEISTPPPFSSESFGKGLIGEEEITMFMIPSNYLRDDCEDKNAVAGHDEKIHLTVCAIRIGSVNLSPVDELTEVPEQRMIFFRSPLLIRNFLALPIAIQVRVKSYSSVSGPSANIREPALLRRSIMLSDWEDLGILDCGGSVNWTGSLSSDVVQIRARFVGVDGDNSRRFPGWSSAVEIPPRHPESRELRGDSSTTVAKMKVYDAENISLSISVALEHGTSIGSGKHSDDESIRNFCRSFSSATRVASLFVPFWIIDGTHQDLEFYAGTSVAGQLDGNQSTVGATATYQSFGNTLGLAELMDNDNFLDISSKSEFDVLMVGEGSSNRLTVRKRPARKGRATVKSSISPWSDPIPLLSGQKTQHDLTVLSPNELIDHSGTISDDPRSFGRLVLRSRIVQAAEKFGGRLGTKLIHIVNRYSVANETGRDIEIDSNGGPHNQHLVSATSRPQAFHFDDSRPIRFRFKEYGWTWSGYFNVRSNRREVTMRIRQKMKGQTIIVTVELRATKQSATSLLVFRQSNHPPFRLENHTMHPLRFGQALSVLGQEETECDSMLLQYQSSDFAWDEPELRRRILIVKSSGSGLVEDMVLGRFLLDKVAPGTAIKLDNDIFTAEIVADGPTRVLRISDASMPRISSFRQDEFDYFKHIPDVSRSFTISLVAKFSHGIGISVVDFTPKELLYARLDDIHVEKKTDTKKDNVTFSIGCIKFNNQLWVTPYPILLKMGRHYDSKTSSRRRNRRHDALSVCWKSSLNTHGGYGNVTLLDSVEVSSEPVFVNVDGELASALYRMVQHIAEIRSHGKELPSTNSRDVELKALLAINFGGETTQDPLDSPRTGKLLLVDPTVDSVTTAASAAKLRSNPDYQHTVNTPRRNHYSGRNSSKKRKRQPTSKVQHKFYIERLRISTTRADLSWSGPLPGMVSSLIFKALTFERLPVRLRPYSSSHAYGNFQDHMQLLRSHYLSFWRIADVLVGLSSNPTFLFRAVIYTLRESCAAMMDSSAATIRESSTKLTRFASRDSEFQPIYYDENLLKDASKKYCILKKACIPFVNGTVVVLNNISSIVTWLSSHLKCGIRSGSAQRTRGLVRSRNPRLFAHVDGKDLLVEYVEGENAGKALLSRVRMGLHLGEGYFFHVEGARQRRTNSKVRTDLDPSPLILMITSERVLLLTGRLDRDFCSVEWESFFLNIVLVTVVPADDLSFFTYDEVIIWHLCDSEFSEGNQIQLDGPNVFATNIVSGIDVLRCKSIFVPRLMGKQVLQKMHNVENRLGH
ncbi:vacuolar sorting-associated protein 13, N-terminal domain containing protein [Nitzschia inconspicua]|uniref:Vacuolar sorting-associated protein 13, N-terminal domain containing protein n=1 Tax=Nitzschia inconspicua TaxID=303405 RepID=A0A9K3L4Y6_9STRA|nr:vacuolar sorting-associated protein 13, N-terminal domain containing protein [Nitzschia inconspicua]